MISIFLKSNGFLKTYLLMVVVDIIREWCIKVKKEEGRNITLGFF
jgi:hypothetical protein